jgi:hypothetical protein
MRDMPSIIAAGAYAYATRSECGGEPARARVDLAPGQSPAAVHDGEVLRIHLGRPGEEGQWGERRVVRRVLVQIALVDVRSVCHAASLGQGAGFQLFPAISMARERSGRFDRSYRAARSVRISAAIRSR